MYGRKIENIIYEKLENGEEVDALIFNDITYDIRQNIIWILLN